MKFSSLLNAMILLTSVTALSFGEKNEMTQSQFVSFMAKGLLEKQDNCPDTDELTNDQSKKLTEYGQKIMENSSGFQNELLAKLKEKNPNASLKKLENCPLEIAVRGPQVCFSVYLSSKKVVDFLVGPYRSAGINCQKPTEKKEQPYKNETQTNFSNTK